MISAIDLFVRFAISMLLAGLWQAPLFALAAWFVLRIKPAANATTRHSVLAAALLASVALPIVTATLAMQHATQPETPALASDVVPPIGAVPYRPAKTPASLPAGTRMPAGRPDTTLSVPSIARLNLALPRFVALTVVGLWLAGSAFVLLRLAISLVHLERLKRDALPLGLDFRENLTRWATANKGPRNVRLCTSPDIDIPIAVGLFDAMILVPRHLLTELAPHEIDAIVLHELAHLRRSDDWFNAIERFASAVLFFNPAIFWLAGQLDLEREVACDDWVLQQNDALPYATCLAKVAETAVWPHRPMTAPGAFVTRRGMSIRIERLLAKHRDVRVRTSFGPAGSVVGVLAVLGIVAAFVSPSIAYSAGEPETDIAVASPTPAASIAPTPQPSPRLVSMPRLVTIPRIVVWPHVAAMPAPKPHPHPAAHPHVVAKTDAGSETSPPPVPAVPAVPTAASIEALTSRSAGRALAMDGRNRARSPQIVAEANAPDYIDELASVGYTHLSIDDLVALKSVGVTASFVRELERNGIKHPSVQQLVQMRAIGTDPHYIAQMRARYGDSLDIDDIDGMHAVGVSSDYAQALTAAGLHGVDADQIKSLRALGVEPEYIAQLIRAGFSDLSADDIAGLKAVGVDGAYAAAMRREFGPSLELGKLTGMRAVGVSPDYVAQLRAAGLSNISPDRITGLRALGVTPDYVRSLTRAGYTSLTSDQIAQLRALGIDGDFIARANQHGFHNLTVDQLIHLKATGVL